jgi:hypothetical protein
VQEPKDGNCAAKKKLKKKKKTKQKTNKKTKKHGLVQQLTKRSTKASECTATALRIYAIFIYSYCIQQTA